MSGILAERTRWLLVWWTMGGYEVVALGPGDIQSIDGTSRAAVDVFCRGAAEVLDAAKVDRPPVLFPPHLVDVVEGVKSGDTKR